MTNNEIIQLIAVGIILLVCIVWIFRRLITRKSKDTQQDCSCGCSDCSLLEHCKGIKANKK